MRALLVGSYGALARYGTKAWALLIFLSISNIFFSSTSHVLRELSRDPIEAKVIHSVAGTVLVREGTRADLQQLRGRFPDVLQLGGKVLLMCAVYTRACSMFPTCTRDSPFPCTSLVTGSRPELRALRVLLHLASCTSS